MGCATCQSEATVHVDAIGCHFCEPCLNKLDARIEELNKYFAVRRAKPKDDNFIPGPESIAAAIERAVKTYRVEVDGLTEKQKCEVFRQAIASGDLKRYVRVTDNSQTVVYIPFADSERQKAEIKRLRELCGEMLATLRTNFLRQTLTTQDDKQFEAMLNAWHNRIYDEPEPQ